MKKFFLFFTTALLITGNVAFAQEAARSIDQIVAPSLKPVLPPLPEPISPVKESKYGAEKPDVGAVRSGTVKPAEPKPNIEKKVEVNGWDEDSTKIINEKSGDLVKQNSEVATVNVTKGGVEVHVKAPAKLFGIISISITKTLSVDAKTKKVKAQFPWWRIFAKVEEDTVASEIESKLQMPIAYFKQQTELQKHIQILDVVSNILKARHDASQQAVSNIK